VVAFEAPGRLAGLREWWVAEGAGERRCVVCRELTKLHEEVRHGTVSTLAAYYTDREVRGEITVVLEGRGGDVPGEPVDEEQALATAIELQVGGRTTQEIARRLRGEFGMTRNRAYELALRAAERK
jgi:16S rRNA (cytidine1402-2'-O)-methyltransferase